MSTPRFSVVIPTRERAETLRYTLRTCLAQDFDDYEVVVSDNHSSPATRQVVAEAASPKVRYVRAPRPLSMSGNWELGVSQARGEYVLIVGDDDGLLGHALKELDRLVREVRMPVVRWTGAFYAWPSIALPGEAHYLRIPLNREVRLRDGHAQMAAVIRYEACYSTLPMVSNSAVHRDVLARWRAATGTLFRNQYPDVYSAFVLAHLAGTYASADTPMTVAGTSGRSYGVATLFLRGRSALDHEFRSFNGNDGLLIHPWVPDLPVFPTVAVADSFQIAKEAHFPQDSTLQVDRRLLSAACVYGLRCVTPEEWETAMGMIRASLADDAELGAWFEANFGAHQWAPTGQFRLRAEHLGYDGDFLHLSADAFGVADIEGAVRLVEKVLNYKAEGIRYDLPSRERLRAA